MKILNRFVKICFLFGLMLFGLVDLSNGDVLPSGDYHEFARCIKFINLDKYPDIVLIGYYDGPMVDKYEAYKIENNVCLSKGYKFNSLSVYRTTQKKFDLIDLKNLTLYSKKVLAGGFDDKGNPVYMDNFYPKNLDILMENLEPYGGYIEGKDPLIKEDIEYSIEGYAGNVLTFKGKKISTFNNSVFTKVEIIGSGNSKKHTNNFRDLFEVKYILIGLAVIAIVAGSFVVLYKIRNRKGK